MFYYDKFENKEILKSSMLEDVNHFFTTRDWNINNDGFGYIKTSRIITPKQTHTDHIEIVDNRDIYPDTDALILDRKDTTIYLKFADCTPLIFYDTKNKVAAIAHAGWRGTAKRIGPKTVQKIYNTYGSNPSDIIAIIGPAIGICCYEVSDDVKKQLLDTIKKKEELFLGKNIDLKRINAQQLREIGVENIDICPFCTSCNNDKFYSYRKENETEKRHYAIISL